MMSWVLGAQGLVLDLEEDRELLGALAVLAPERPGLVPGAVDALMDLLARNADGDRGARIRLGELFAGYSPMDLSQIGDLWRRLPRTPHALSREQLRPLLCPLDMVGRGPCEELGTRVVWPVVGGASSVDEQASAKVRLMLGGSAEISGGARQRLVLDGLPRLPASIGAPGGCLRIGLDGAARSALSAGIPIRLGGVSASATGRNALALEYYLDADQGASFAASAARHLGSLPDPYDLGQVAVAVAGDAQGPGPEARRGAGRGAWRGSQRARAGPRRQAQALRPRGRSIRSGYRLAGLLPGAEEAAARGRGDRDGSGWKPALEECWRGRYRFEPRRGAAVSGYRQ